VGQQVEGAPQQRRAGLEARLGEPALQEEARQLPKVGSLVGAHGTRGRGSAGHDEREPRGKDDGRRAQAGEPAPRGEPGARAGEGGDHYPRHEEREGGEHQRVELRARAEAEERPARNEAAHAHQGERDGEADVENGVENPADAGVRRC
jgi:hypothetical protein